MKQNVNKCEEILVEVRQNRCRMCSVFEEESKVDVFESIITDYIGMKRVPKLVKKLKSAEAKRKKPELLIRWKDNAMYSIVDINGKLELRLYQSESYEDIEKQIREIVKDQMLECDVEEFVGRYMAEMTEKMVFTEQIVSFISAVEKLFKKISVSKEYTENVKNFFETLKREFDYIKVSDDSRGQIICFLTTFEEMLEENINLNVHSLMSKNFIKGLEEELGNIKFMKREARKVQNIIWRIKDVNARTMIFFKKTVNVEASDSPIYMEVLDYIPQGYKQTQFVRNLETAVKNGISGFLFSCAKPFIADNGRLEFNESITTEFEHSWNWWNEKAKQLGCSMGSKYEFTMYRAQLIYKMLESGISKEEAYYAICDTPEEDKGTMILDRFPDQGRGARDESYYIVESGYVVATRSFHGLYGGDGNPMSSGFGWFVYREA